MTYTLDSVGSRTGRVDGLGTHTYAYDDLYRQTSVTYPGPTTDDYTYDAVGNRLTKDSDDYTYDAADRLTDLEGVTYGYDDNGNLTNRGSDSFSWDAADRLTSATVSSVTTTFVYNGDGLRESLTTGGSTTTFTWDLAQGIPQILDDGDLRYIYGLGRIAQVDDSDVTHYYLSDALGSTMALTDSAGDVVNDYEYDVFGAVSASSGSLANFFEFAGEQVDDSTDLQYLRARYYDVASGRFLGRDPVAEFAPIGITPYVYSFNNPANFTDPWGTWPGCGICKKAVDAVGDGASAVGSHVYDKARDTVLAAGHCAASLGTTCTSDAIGLGISYLSTGDRKTGPNGFVYYENCQGLCDWINQALNQFAPTSAFTPGFISFADAQLPGGLLCHEYQHFIQSRVTGPFYIPLALTPWFERDAASASDKKEGHFPFTGLSIPGRCQ